MRHRHRHRLRQQQRQLRRMRVQLLLPCRQCQRMVMARRQGRRQRRRRSLVIEGSTSVEVRRSIITIMTAMVPLLALRHQVQEVALALEQVEMVTRLRRRCHLRRVLRTRHLGVQRHQQQPQ